MSCLPYGLAVAVISQKKGNTKNVTHAICSGRDCHGAKTNKKQKMSRSPSGLALPAKGPKFEGKTKNVTHAVWP